jgi:hypothetical protein
MLAAPTYTRGLSRQSQVRLRSDSIWYCRRVSIVRCSYRFKIQHNPEKVSSVQGRFHPEGDADTIA